MTKTTTAASTCPFTTNIVIITTLAIVIIITVIIHPSYSIRLLRQPTGDQSTDDEHVMDDTKGHLQSDVMTTTMTMTGDHYNEQDKENDPYNATGHGSHDSDALNRSSTVFSVTDDFMRLLINSYHKQASSSSSSADGDSDDNDYITCYITTNVALAERTFVVNNGDDDDDDDDDVKESTDVLTFKVVVKKYKSISSHPHPPPPPHQHHHQHRQRNGSHGDRQPIKFCLRRETNVNREKNSSDLYGRINYDNEEAGNETNGSGLLKMDNSIESDNRTPPKSTRTQAVVITTSSIVITVFFFTAVFLRIRNHIKRYRNSVRHKNNLRLHTSKCCQSELSSTSPKSRKFSKFLNILTNHNPSHFQETQLQPIQSEIRNLKLYYNETSRSDADDFDDDAILPEVEEEIRNGDQLFKDSGRQSENKSVRFFLNDHRLPVLRSQSYHNDRSVSMAGDTCEEGRFCDVRKNLQKKSRRKFSFQGGGGGGNQFDLRRVSRFQSNKSRRELLHRCLEQLNNSSVNE